MYGCDFNMTIALTVLFLHKLQFIIFDVEKPSGTV